MPRFFFNTADGDCIADEEGAEFPSLTEARHEAARVIGEILKEQPEAFWQDRALKLTVTDEHGRMLFSVEVNATVAAPAC